MSITPRTDRADRNIVINGNFDYWQRVVANTTTLTGTGAGFAFTADRAFTSHTTTASKSVSIVRSSVVPTPAQSGVQSLFSFQHTNNTGIALSAADFYQPYTYAMEGLDYARLHGGLDMTLSFWFFGSAAGSYAVALRNSDNTRSYVTTFNYAAPSVWQKIAINLTSDTIGNWTLDTSRSLNFIIAGQSGSTQQTGSLNVWQAGNFISAAGVVNLAGSTGGFIRIAQVCLYQGTQDSPIFSRYGGEISSELIACQRYYEKSYSIDNVPAAITATGVVNYTGIVSGQNLYSVQFKVQKRTISTYTFYAYHSGASGNWTLNGTTNTAAILQVAGEGSFTVNVTGGAGNPNLGGHWTADCELS